LDTKNVLNLSLKEEELYYYFKAKNSYKIFNLQNDITEKIDNLKPIGINSENDIIICDIFTYDNSNYVSNYFRGSPYAICPEILRYVFQFKPKLFFITLDSNYISTSHFDNFKLHCHMVNYHIMEIEIEKSLYHIVIGFNENIISNLSDKISSLDSIINKEGSNKKNIKIKTLLDNTISIFMPEGD